MKFKSIFVAISIVLVIANTASASFKFAEFELQSVTLRKNTKPFRTTVLESLRGRDEVNKVRSRSDAGQGSNSVPSSNASDQSFENDYGLSDKEIEAISGRYIFNK